MPKQNYHQARKQKEQARKARQQAKQERRTTTRPGTGEEGSEAPANEVIPAPELIPPAA
jgi:hypothetical protein